MSIIETIRAEIERRMDKHWEGLPNADSPEDDWTHNELCELGAYKELEHLETFLDTLELAEQTNKVLMGRPIKSDSINLDAIEASESQTFDLEKEVDKTVNECTDGYNFDWEKFALHFCELGATKMKEQMMKNATPFYEILKVVPPGPERDIVKLIIIKENAE